MGIQFPDTLTVSCDDCGEEKDFDATQYCDGDGTSVGVDSSTVEEEDWVKDGDEFYCPNCVKTREGD